MHGESSLHLIAFTGGTDVSNSSDLNIICNKIVQYLQGGLQKCPYFSFAINFTKIKKLSIFFLHRYWKFIEFFWCKSL